MTPAARLRGLAEDHPRHLTLAAAALGLTLAQAPAHVALTAAALIAGGLALAAAPSAAVMAAAALLAGSLAGHARIAAIDAPGQGLRPGDRVEGRAHLLGLPLPGPFGSSAEVRMSSGLAEGVRLLARFPRDADVPPGTGIGSEVAIAGSVRAPRPAESGEFNFAAYLLRRGVAGELAADTLVVTGRRRGGLAGAIDVVRTRSEQALAHGLPPPEAALARGMVMGQDEAIDPTVRDDFRASGLAHVLAVSGQNVMLLAALALPLLGAAGLSGGARIAITVGLIALYVPLAGAGPSLQRAGVVGAASLVALAASRPASRWYGLLLAACVTLALNPRACWDPGWQLSFAAVVGILAGAPRLRALLAGLPHPLAEGVAVTVSATLATAPLLAHHFGAVSPASLPANVIALPLVAPIMWLGMLRAAFGQLAPLGWPAAPAASVVNASIGAALEPLAAALSALASAFADLPGSQVGVPLSSVAGVAVAYAALGTAAVATARAIARTETARAPLAAAWRRVPRARRAAIVFALTAVIALVLVRATAPPPPPQLLTVSFLDVGQGDATLVQHPDGSAVLFDGGPPEGRVAWLLRAAGVRRLSAVVMTHASRDHHGGLAEVVERYPVELLVDGGDGTRDRGFRAIVAEAIDRGARRVAATAPMTLSAGGISIAVLSPAPRTPGPAPEDPNPRALVTVVRAGGFELLLSADAESPSLTPLALPDVDAMKVPHHGSSDPGLPEVLERLRPEVAAIEVGENSYGHPAPSTIAALEAAGVPTFRTDHDGTVRLTVVGGDMSVDAEQRD